MTDNVEPVVRHIKPLHHRAIIGIDGLTVTPVDINGNYYIYVIVNFTTKIAKLYPAKAHDAASAATAVVQYIVTYGLFDCIASDPGSDFTSDVLKHLEDYFGIQHRFSLVDNHTSNGVEGSNKKILRHLKAMVMETRMVKEWSNPTILALVEFFLNNTDNSEIGMTPYHLNFGTLDATYYQIPSLVNETNVPIETSHEFVKLL